MKKIPASVWFLSVLLAACGGPEVDTLDADDDVSEDSLTIGPYDPCLAWANSAPNYILTMSSGIKTRRQNIASYPPVIGGCAGRASVEIRVPSSSGCSTCVPTIELAAGLYDFDDPVASPDPDFPVPSPLPAHGGATRCQSYQVLGSIYYRSSTSSPYARVQTFDLRGEWTGSACRVRDVTSGGLGYVVRTVAPPSTGTRYWKVILGGRLEGVLEPVRLRAQHPTAY